MLEEEVNCLVSLGPVLTCVVKTPEVLKVSGCLQLQVCQFVAVVPHVLILGSDRVRVILGTVKGVVLSNNLRHVEGVAN